MESIGLGQAELPLIVIVDVMAGYMAICDKPDVSETVLMEFISDYRTGRLKVVPLPQPNAQVWYFNDFIQGALGKPSDLLRSYSLRKPNFFK